MKKIIFIIPLLLVLSISVSSCHDNNPGNQEPPLLGSEPPMGSEGFDLQTAIELMFLSLEAYQMLADSEDGTTFTLPEPYDLVIQILTPESFTSEGFDEEVPIAFIATKDDNIYVVFRGTKTISEWIIDADFPFVPYVDPGGGMTEQGFTDFYEDFNDLIISTVNMLKEQGTFNNLYITGHSLGAALAVVSTPDLLMKTGFENPVMYNFAGPRVGDSDFKTFYDAFNLESWRVFNTNDLVPMLPPELLGYTHVENGFPITFGQPIEDPLDFSAIAEDHDSCTYYNTLCEMLGSESEIMECKMNAMGLDGCNIDL
ncbi:MAG: lipase family protein [Thermodesulfobacteriota bacterium]